MSQHKVILGVGSWNSKPRSIASGLPQGSIIVPVLFLAYTSCIAAIDASGRNNGNQAAAKTETSEALTGIRSRHLEDDILQSPPSFHPGNQHLVKTRRDQHRAVEAELPGDSPRRLPAVCLHQPDGRVCGVAFKRYYFDPATLECHKFIYGGCQDSSNSFETLKSCNMACLGHE